MAVHGQECMCRDTLSREGRSVWVSLDGRLQSNVSSRLVHAWRRHRSGRVIEVFAITITPSLLPSTPSLPQIEYALGYLLATRQPATPPCSSLSLSLSLTPSLGCLPATRCSVINTSYSHLPPPTSHLSPPVWSHELHLCLPLTCLFDGPADGPSPVPVPVSATPWPPLMNLSPASESPVFSSWARRQRRQRRQPNQAAHTSSHASKATLQIHDSWDNPPLDNLSGTITQ